MKKKELYAAPETEVLELHIENAILDASGGLQDFNETTETGGWS